MTIEQLLRKSANELNAYETTLEDTLYSSYTPEELGKKLLELEALRSGLELLAESELIIVHQVMEC